MDPFGRCSSFAATHCEGHIVAMYVHALQHFREACSDALVYPLQVAACMEQIETALRCTTEFHDPMPGGGAICFGGPRAAEAFPLDDWRCDVVAVRVLIAAPARQELSSSALGIFRSDHFAASVYSDDGAYNDGAQPVVTNASDLHTIV